MSKHKYIPNPTNLFEGKIEEDHVDGTHCINSFRSRFPLQPKSNRVQKKLHEDYERQLRSEKTRVIEQRTLESSERSLRMLHDSEEKGITSARELVCQHEQLSNVNKKLDEINPKLASSQRHLNGINSIFYSLRRYFSSKSDPGCSTRQDCDNSGSCSTRSKCLKSTLNILTQERDETTDKFNSHPSTRLRNVDEHLLTGGISDNKCVDDTLEANLNEMGHVISRLKDLGLALGEEIDEQNELISTLSDKAEEAEIKIGKQNSMINKLLGN